MENEENRGRIHKKTSEDQLVTFCQFKFGALSLFSLSLSLTFGHVEYSWSNLVWIKEGKERKGKGRKKSKINQLQQEYLRVTFCMCDFLAGLDMHGFACWCMVLLLSMAWFCWVMTMVFNLALPFSRCHCVGMFTLFFEIWFVGWISESGAEVVSRFIPKVLRIP